MRKARDKAFREIRAAVRKNPSTENLQILEAEIRRREPRPRPPTGIDALTDIREGYIRKMAKIRSESSSEKI